MPRVPKVRISTVQRFGVRQYYVWVRMAIVLVCAKSLLIRCSRDWQCPRHPVIFDRQAMNNWRTWSEQYGPSRFLSELNALATLLATAVRHAHSSTAPALSQGMVISETATAVGLLVGLLGNVYITSQADWNFG